jgi:hypothetical protein
VKSSVATSIDRIGDSLPICLAMIWSTVVPARKSCPSVSLAVTLLNQPAEARAWSGSSPGRSIRLTTVTWFRYGSSGFSVGLNSNPDPLVAGIQLSRITPFGT